MIDLIVGGCQGFSMANRKRIEDAEIYFLEISLMQLKS